MQLGSARALKQQLDDKLRQRNALMEKVAYRVGGLGDVYIQEIFRPPLAKGIVRLGPREYGIAIRVYEGKDRIARGLLRPLQRYTHELRVAYGVAYRPRSRFVQPALLAGFSIGHYKITAGTLGGFVRDREGVYVLSNNHVLANCNDAEPFDPIVMPGPSDIPRTGSYAVVARLARWLELHQHRPDGLDAAIAGLHGGQNFKPSFVPGVGRVERDPVQNRYAVHGVFKHGRTTKLTRGIVTAFELDDVMVNYGTPKQPYWLQFDNQIEFENPNPGAVFSKGGDSGSVIYDDASRRPYALLFAGGPDATGRDRTLGHFLPDVLENLGVEML